MEKVTITIVEYKHRYEVWTEAYCLGRYRKHFGARLERDELVEKSKGLLKYWGFKVSVKRTKAQGELWSSRVKF